MSGDHHFGGWQHSWSLRYRGRTCRDDVGDLPRAEVLARLAEAGVLTYRTDLDGAVTFYLDGKTVNPGIP